ncbi:hypothetical protein FPQ18DRAFT_398879 [Pyronema domesticum]|uniref:Similar to UPF0382 membrane protein C1782.12c acc. no. Q9P7G8 n=1 Tax=Pyronema omphalodes (strain CBS 100304) TaxID=1076935 RepID=U4LE49_PYROM|nr:hypothetical protein FPQ18DRAFT_398879 [Pyronema domesticum]CCX30379.1 Similar to UPF0382 membrane protein C1782.12c; acc. no. Q9P7G8 [Pyronema omphalodes CBS 100304]
MPTSPSLWTIGCLYGASAVAFGAFGAHGLRARIADPARIKSWETAAHYQLIHSVAVLLSSANPVAAGLFTAGMTMFSGSIYAMTLIGPEKLKSTGWGKVLGPMTPVGGVFLIAGWVMLARKGKIQL